MPGERREWSPQFAPHVQGYYYERTLGEDGLPEESEVGAKCTTCGETFQRKCSSGLFREWIARFARVHLHRSPLEPRKP